MTDKGTIRIVVVALSLAALGGEVALALLVWSKVPAAELAVVAGLAGQALGALTGMLISTRSDPQEVTVSNEPSDPIPVEEAGHADLSYVVVAALVAFVVVVAANVWVFDLPVR